MYRRVGRVGDAVCVVECGLKRPITIGAVASVRAVALYLVQLNVQSYSLDGANVQL